MFDNLFTYRNEIRLSERSNLDGPWDLSSTATEHSQPPGTFWEKRTLNQLILHCVNICYLSTEYAINVFLVQMGGHNLDPLRREIRFSNSYANQHHNVLKGELLYAKAWDLWTFWEELHAVWICLRQLTKCLRFGNHRAAISKGDWDVPHSHFLPLHGRKWLYCWNGPSLPNECPAESFAIGLRKAWPFPAIPDWPFTDWQKSQCDLYVTIYVMWINHLTTSSVHDRCATASVMWRVDGDTRAVLRPGSCSKMVLWTLRTAWTIYIGE